MTIPKDIEIKVCKDIRYTPMTQLIDRHCIELDLTIKLKRKSEEILQHYLLKFRGKHIPFRKSILCGAILYIAGILEWENGNLKDRRTQQEIADVVECTTTSLVRVYRHINEQLNINFHQPKDVWKFLCFSNRRV